VETWQIGLYVFGGLLLVFYFKRRSDRMRKGES
jgi:hypothetical protein